MQREACGEEEPRRKSAAEGQKLVDYSLHVRAEYWDRLNVLLSSAQQPCSALPTVTVTVSLISRPAVTVFTVLYKYS